MRTALVAFSVVAVAAAALLYARVQQNRRRRRTIKELSVFPIKGCLGVRVQSIAVTRRGLKHDRSMMVVDANNKFISQRSYPRMVLIKTRLEEGAGGRPLLRVSAPSGEGQGQDDLVIELPSDYDSKEEEEELMGRGRQSSPYLTVTVWGAECLAYEVAQEASAWFSKCLSRGGGEKPENLRLVRMARENVRPCKLTDKGQTGFSDQYPLLLASTASMADLTRRLPRSAGHVKMDSFRANVVVDGCIRPWEEDTWREVAFSCEPEQDITMRVVSHCSRCKVPTNIIERGCFDENDEPTRTMRTFRQGKELGLTGKAERELYFGVNLDNASLNSGTLSVGQSLRPRP